MSIASSSLAPAMRRFKSSRTAAKAGSQPSAENQLDDRTYSRSVETPPASTSQSCEYAKGEESESTVKAFCHFTWPQTPDTPRPLHHPAPAAPRPAQPPLRPAARTHPTLGDLAPCRSGTARDLLTAYRP